MSPCPLEARVLGCMPVSAQAFGALLSLLSIEASDAVPTACVTTGARSRLLLNPDFVARRCRTDEHLAMLVMHELHHVLLGHTRLYPRVTLAQNWAFDCLINAQLCRLFPEPRHASFFGQLLGEARGAALLLGPPAGWRPERDWRDGLRETLSSPDVQVRYGRAYLLLAQMHWRLYSDESTGFEELYRLLAVAPLAGDGGDPRPDALPLLGGHGPDDVEDALHPELRREVREILARWPMIDRRSGRDQGGALQADRVPLGVRRRRAVDVLRRTIAVASGLEGAAQVSRVADTALELRTPVDGGRDRRAWVQRCAGVQPLLFDGTLPARGPVPVERVRVYLDVSGSMDAVLPPLYAALAGCLDAVEPIIRAFSTRVGALSHAQLLDGVTLTTGGTDIETVTAHLLATGARRAVIVTDGWVGQVPADHLAELRRRRVRIAVAVTRPGDPAFAESIGLPVFRLPELA
jgi:hypothetical protein